MKSDFFLTDIKNDLGDWQHRDVLCQLGYMGDIFHEMSELNLQLQGFNKNILETLKQCNIHLTLLVINTRKLIAN